MANLLLVIGNQNYSSWSLRPWLTLKMLGAAFRQAKILLHKPDTREQILKYSPAGRVPVLLDGDLSIWDSLSIQEYLAEIFPDAGVWPADRLARATARSISAEMHSGFAALRREMPMDCRSRRSVKPSPEAQADIDRVLELWRDCRARWGGSGDFLFGRFCAADAMYAPVATRFVTYGVELDPVCSAYRDSLCSLPPMQQWLAEAEAEKDVFEY